MTITADARSSASTAAGPPTSSPVSVGAPHTDVVSPYGTALSAPDDPHGDGSRGSEPDAARPVAHTPSSAHRRLPPAPVRARIVAGVIDLVIGSLLVGGLTTVIWQVGGRPVLTSGLIAFGLVVGARWLAIAATGWSLGGRLLRIRMLGARNQTPSPLGSFLHADLILAVSITTLGLGTIALMRTAAADSEGRGWHDKLSGMALLSAHRTRRPAPSSAASERRPVTEPASSGPRIDAGADTPEESTSRDIGEAWDAARRASLSSSDEQGATSREPASEPSTQATEVPDESASRARPSERAERKAEKKAGKAARGKKARKRGPRPGSTRARSGQEAAQETRQATAAGAQSAAEAGITESSGRSAHPTTSDPVSSSIRRPRPARPGRPARHAGRALNTGSSSGYASAVSETSAEEQAVSTSAATTTAAPHTAAKATKAATVSSSASAKSAASAGPAIVETDAEAVAVASATPMDPQASAAMAAARAESRPAVEEASRPSAGPADEDAVATAPKAPKGATSPAQEDADTAPDNLTEATEPAAHDAAPEASSEPTSPTSTEEPAEAGVEEPSAAASSSSDNAASQQPSPMDTETATLDVVEDAPSQSTDDADSQDDEAEKPSTHAPPSSQHPVDQQQSEATTPSAESSKTAADSEASQSSTSHDATSTPQVPRSKATKPVTSQTMEPRHAHAQRWRIQPGHTGKKSSGSSAAPAEDQRESVSQPGVPRRESLFTTERQRFAAGAGPVPEVAHTFDTSSILPSGDRNTQALIDSVPWSSVPTSVDAATVDSLPEGVIVTDDDSSRKPEEAEVSSPRAAQMDLTNPSTVPGGVPASSEGQAHPTVRSHRSHAQAPVSSGSTSATATEETPSRRPHTTHRFHGPGIPAPAEEAEAPASRRERRDAAQAPAGSRTSSAASTSRRSGARTGDRTAGVAGSLTNAAAPTSAPAAASHPTAASVPAVSAQAATPSLPSASSASPALSVRLVPLLGGNPILIHEPTVVGRDPDNISAYPGAERVALDDPTRSVSKTHAAIFPLLDGVWVTDLHSTNGTRVEYRDGRSVEAVPDKALSALEGSTIFFGRIAFKVEVV